MDGYFKGRRLVEYQSLGDFATGQNFIVHHLPHPWAGVNANLSNTVSDVHTENHMIR